MNKLKRVWQRGFWHGFGIAIVGSFVATLIGLWILSL